jgi:phospholipid/cholesterol/gamma-HCH transport system substrate-binding protein
MASEKSAEESDKSKSKFQAPPRTYGLEFWVGVFTLFGVVCFAYLSINIGGMEFSGAGYYTIKARFTNVAGLKVGAPLEIAGVRVGDVKQIALDGTDAMVTMRVKEHISVREDDIAQIRTKGIIGDRYIKLSPGGADDLLAQGDQLSDTESAVEFEEIIGKFVHSLGDE